MTSAYGACDVESIRTDANACLNANGVAQGVEFLFPVLQNAAAVTNFCTTKLADIKACIGGILSTCKTDEHSLKLFGESGASLLAAYDGICAETDKDTILVCGLTAAPIISSSVTAFVTSVDALQAGATFAATCTPMATLHTSLTAAIASACTGMDTAPLIAYEYFLKTLEFPCKDVTTPCYPCTFEQINTDAIACYSTSGVTVTNGFVPTPITGQVATMCSSKTAIQNCIQGLIRNCAAEPQVYNLLGTDGAAFVAGYDCLCATSVPADTISCPNGGNMVTGMTTFTNGIHALAIAGAVTKTTVCGLFTNLKTTATTAIETACNDNSFHPDWHTYLDTLVYPCTDARTSCYPSGAQMVGKGAIIVIFITISIIFLAV